MADNHVRIIIPSEHSDLPNERVWAVPHPSIPNVYRVDNVLLNPCEIAYGDWVECTPPRRKNGNVRRVCRVYQPSGYGRAFVEVDENRPTRAPDFFAFVEALTALEWPLESMHDAFWLIVAVPPGQKQAAEALVAQHPGVALKWTIEPLSHDPRKHPVILSEPVEALTSAWRALTDSFLDRAHSSPEDISEATRVALQRLGRLLDPLEDEEM